MGIKRRLGPLTLSAVLALSAQSFGLTAVNAASKTSDYYFVTPTNAAYTPGPTSLTFEVLGFGRKKMLYPNGKLLVLLNGTTFCETEVVAGTSIPIGCTGNLNIGTADFYAYFTGTGKYAGVTAQNTWSTQVQSFSFTGFIPVKFKPAKNSCEPWYRVAAFGGDEAPGRTISVYLRTPKRWKLVAATTVSSDRSWTVTLPGWWRGSRIFTSSWKATDGVTWQIWPERSRSKASLTTMNSRGC